MKTNRKRIASILLSGLLLSALFCGVVFAQSTAQMSGAVKDQTGAVLPGVEVTATQTDTGIARTAVTDETGSYVLANLPLGPYRLEAALPGFRSYAQTGIVLQVGSNPVINAVLEVGQVSDQIEVQADAVMVETRSTGVGQVIDNVRVLELPLNARQVSELILLSGAAVAGGAQGTNRNYPTESISVGGGMNNGLTYLLDGGTHNDPYNNLNLPLPFPDALQEFKVETSAVPAQYGQHSAGAVNAVTKSGTNAFHGSLFEFVRNKVFNARNAFALRRDGLKRNQFGGTVGGPIIRNKLFFFAGFQGTRERSEPSDLRTYVPTPAMLAGDFSVINSPACRSRTVTLRAPFVNNRVDPALFSPVALNLVRRLPTTDDAACGEVRYGLRTSQDENVAVGRVDYQRNEKHSLFGRFEGAFLDTPTPYDGKNVLTAQGLFERRAHSAVLGDTYLIGTSTINSFRATLLRTVFNRTNPGFFTHAELGAKGVYAPEGHPKMAPTSVTDGFTLPGATQTQALTNSTIFEFGDNVSWVKGAHQIGFGGNVIHTKMNVLANTQSNGVFAFTDVNTGLGMGDFLLGRPESFGQDNRSTWYPRQNYFALYIQDTFRMTPRFTVNAGLRWEPFLAPWSKDGRQLHFKQEWFDKGIRSSVYKNAPVGILFRGDPGMPDNNSISASHWLHLAPRLGLAWDPSGNGRMTVRAAYGVFFDYPHLYQFNGQRSMPPWGSRVSLINPVGGYADPWLGFPGGSPYPSTPGPDAVFPPNGIFVNVPQDMKAPYVHQWNLSIQRQIGEDWLVAGNYMGNSIIHLLNTHEGNPAIYLPGASCVINGRTFTPCSSTANTVQRRALVMRNPAQGQYYGPMVQVDDGGTRNYNGLWLQIQRRRARGLTVQANYTWAHCIGDGTSTLFQDDGGAVEERRGANRGNCDLDRRHNFNMSTVYETPQFTNPALRALGTNWRVSGIVRILAGSSLTILSGRDTSLSGSPTDRRPNQILADPYATNKTLDRYLNPAAFAQPASGTYGNMGTGNVRGPGSFRIDIGLTRAFRIRENQSVEFRAEAFNIPNHLNPGNPNTTLTNANFGRILTAGDPRIMQLALKYVF